ncbi:MAG: hypothetical protein NVSMB64_00830 [Candidatus Velthaea sp.]
MTAGADGPRWEITYLYNVSAQMKVDRFCVKFCFAILFSALSCWPASIAGAAGEIPGYRRLVELESARTFSGELVRGLQARDSALASRTALALGRTKDQRAAAPLLASMRSVRDTSVRAMSTYGYGLLAGRAVLDGNAIARTLRDPSPAVRTAAVDAAQRYIYAKQARAEALASGLSALMRADPDPIVRARAAVALAAFVDTPQSPSVGAAVFAAFGREQNATVRWHEAWTLGRAFPTIPTAAQITQALADKDDLVRMEFLVVAGRHGDPNLAKEIEPLTRDGSWRVAETAVESIKRLAGAARTEHVTAIPEGIATPGPVAEETSAALPRPETSGAPHRPGPSEARLDIALRVPVAAALDGPLPGAHPRVRIGTTKGPIVVRLYPEWAPLTVANFLNLANRGYYDNLRWFRIVPNFVAQTGDPKNDGEGDAGYMIPAEENPLEQRPGIISMGLNYEKGDAIRDSAGTQFYLTMSPQMHLNRAFTVFGEIESGFNVLGRLIESDTMTKVEQIADD